MGVSFMFLAVPKGETPQPVSFFPRLCLVNFDLLNPPLSNPEYSCLTSHSHKLHLSEEIEMRGQQRATNTYSLTVQTSAGTFSAGTKSPLHNSIALKTSRATQYSDSKTGLIKISQRFL